MNFTMDACRFSFITVRLFDVIPDGHDEVLRLDPI